MIKNIFSKYTCCNSPLNKNNSIIWLRVFAMCMILICHYVVFSKKELIVMSSQFFNVGVQIFLAISGYLYSNKKIKNPKKWLFYRVLKIQIPYYVFLFFLLVVYIVKNITISYKLLFASLFDMQLFFPVLNGVEHLWFLFVIITCYLILPFVKATDDKINFKNLSMLKVFFIIAVFLIVFLTLIYLKTFSRIVWCWFNFFCGYIIGAKRIKVETKKQNIILFFCFLFSCIFRLAGKYFFDGTFFYDRWLVSFTQTILAAVFLIVFISFDFDKFGVLVNRIVSFISSVSYEIYIVHYMFLHGPVSIIGFTGILIFDSLMITVISLCIGGGYTLSHRNYLGKLYEIKTNPFVYVT